MQQHYRVSWLQCWFSENHSNEERKLRMSLNLDSIGKSIGPLTRSYDWKDVVLYALGVGCGYDHLEYCYEKDLKVLPGFSIAAIFDLFQEVQRAEVGGRRSEIRGQRSEVRDQRSEIRGQRSEVGGQRSEIRGRRSEGGGQRSEGGGRKSAVRG